MNRVFSAASKVSSLPLLNYLSPAANRLPSTAETTGYLTAQRVAMQAATEVAKLISEGWTEKQAAALLNSYLRDLGVKSFFHHAFVWFGDRTRFVGIKTYRDFLATDRVLLPNTVFILDVAPIYRGYICDIGYTGCLGENSEYKKARAFLGSLRTEIPQLFASGGSGSDIWRIIAEKIRDAGYDNIHQKYPFSVLGHRVHIAPELARHAKFINFGWQSYWSLLSRGLFGQLLNIHFNGSLLGLWAIEPHIGGKDFGAKFEEILVVTDKACYWLESENKNVGA